MTHLGLKGVANTVLVSVITYFLQAHLKSKSICGVYLYLSLYKPTISWYKLGHAISDMFSSNEVEQIGNDLHFINLKPEFSGSYSCIALNKAGSDQIEFELSVRQRLRSNFFRKNGSFEPPRFLTFRKTEIFVISKYRDFQRFRIPPFLKFRNTAIF